ncbi:hypothetical protein CCP4SC76_1690014 [Gammaproteobacteria bacterium]
MNLIEKTSYKWPDGTKARLQAVALEGESPEQTWLRALAYLEKAPQPGTGDTSSGTLVTLISRVETLEAQGNSLPPPEIIIWRERNENRLDDLEYAIRTIQDRLDALVTPTPDTLSPPCASVADEVVGSVSESTSNNPELSMAQPESLALPSETIEPVAIPLDDVKDIKKEPKGHRYSKRTKKLAVKLFNQGKPLDSIRAMILKAEGFAPTRRQLPTRLAKWRKELNG